MEQPSYGGRRELSNSPASYSPLAAAATAATSSSSSTSPLPSPFNPPPYLTRSNSPSPKTSSSSSTNPRFLFPSPTTPTAASLPPSHAPPSNRFQEALATLPLPRSKSTPPSPDSPKFHFPPEVASPNGSEEEAFGTIRRELDDPASSALFGSSGMMERRFGNGNGFRGSSPNVGGRERRKGSAEEGERERDGREEEEDAQEEEGTIPGGFGRPASMDMGDTSYDFLLSPPPSFDPSIASRQFAAAAATETIRGKERERPTPRSEYRTFPAPLLLKADRPFGGLSSSSTSNFAPSPLPTATHSIGAPPLRTTSNISINTNPSSSSMTQSLSQSSSSSRPWAYQSSPVFPGPPLSSFSSTPSTSTTVPLPYRQTRQNYSTDSSSHASPSTSQSSIFYSHSPSVSTSSVTTGLSHGTGGSSNPSVLSNSTTSLVSPNTLSTSTSVSQSTPGLIPLNVPSTNDSPISTQDLLSVVLALRLNLPPQPQAQSMGRSQSETSNATTKGSLYSQVVAGPSHARGGSTNSVDNDESSPSSGRNSNAGILDTVDLSNQRIAQVPIEVIDELRDEVEKLALGYNLLRDLPMHFAVLGNRLRYLNVRVNMLTTFPSVVSTRIHSARSEESLNLIYFSTFCSCAKCLLWRFSTLVETRLNGCHSTLGLSSISKYVFLGRLAFKTQRQLDTFVLPTGSLDR